jgi:orotidine-5'-phosphate decarboxylase
MSSPIYVAIDTPDIDRAKDIALKVKGHVGGLKLGLEFFSAHGRAGVREMAAIGLPIFLDLKLHDIPNTVAKAVQALRTVQPAILTVHAAGDGGCQGSSTRGNTGCWRNRAHQP